ncbi:hypothetical protein DSM112329_01801 [Paraconexibacter sp. AEG42_29]|uniref:DUF2157 domain-containing protein n=1 Tax=Paraconexibacter sp. AEG42_29 TaxID=2997339 RepID=A0AAU7ATG4_9ACTN
MLELLRPKPFRGDQVAAGTVVLVLLVALLESRFGDAWAVGVHLAYTTAAAALVLGMSVAAPREPDGPPAWHSTLYVAGFLLAGLALLNLGDLLGADGGAGLFSWVGALLTALATWMSRGRDAASGTLLAAVAGVGTTVAFVSFAFDPDGGGAYRWLLLADAVVLALMALWQRIRGPAHGVQLLNAAGLALLAIAAIFALEAFDGLLGLVFDVTPETGTLYGDERDESPGGVGWGWTMLMLAGGIGILSAGAADNERGNVLVGIAVLLAFTIMAADGNLVGWPIIFAVAAVAFLVIGLRPSTPVPDEPPAGAGGDPSDGARLPFPRPR